ncbi:MAG: hypothetical protein IPI88_10735 [Chitinophagaceae bacterium]|nr:hypothetical protein [Chitinophagaceae bacterium]
MEQETLPEQVLNRVPGCMVSVTSLTNITNVNFGIERLPDSDDKIISYPKTYRALNMI